MKPFHFHKIGIISRKPDTKRVAFIKELLEFLIKYNLTIYIDEEIGDFGDHTATKKSIREQCELAIVVGGDGSILYAARALAGYNIPVVGINKGKLGFLADIKPCNFTQELLPMLQGDFIQYEIPLLHTDIYHTNGYISHNDAVNDIVINSSNITRMIEFELYIDNEFVYGQLSDGIIIATPTGSTAYALSGGGPVVHPKLNSLVLVPMFAHNLTSRPIVIHNDAKIEVLLKKCGDLTAGVSCDGQTLIPVSTDDKITIKKSEKTLKLLHPVNYSYYATLSNKLHWHRELDFNS